MEEPIISQEEQKQNELNYLTALINSYFSKMEQKDLRFINLFIKHFCEQNFKENENESN